MDKQKLLSELYDQLKELSMEITVNDAVNFLKKLGRDQLIAQRRLLEMAIDEIDKDE